MAGTDIRYARAVGGRRDKRDRESWFGVSGHARTYTGRRSLGLVLLDRVQRYVRTEFWW